jgi:C1A family cysteine protease
MMTYTPKLGGWKCDSSQPAADQQVDLKFDDLAPKLAVKASSESGVIDLREFCTAVEDQGHLGSCVGNAIVGALELSQKRDGKFFADLSRLFVYYNSRLMLGEAGNDSGTIIRVAMGTLAAIGTCTENKWPYDISQVFVRPTWGSYREAYAAKIDKFYRIDGTGTDRINAIRQALAAHHPVVFGTNVDQGFMDTGSNGLVPPYSGKSLGGHALLIVGIDDNEQRLIVRNSWGLLWGDLGYCYMPFSYIDAAEADDFWVVTLA